MAQVTSNLYTRIPAELNEKLETYLKETGETKTDVVKGLSTKKIRGFENENYAELKEDHKQAARVGQRRKIYAYELIEEFGIIRIR